MKFSFNAFQYSTPLPIFSACGPDWLDLGEEHGCFYFAADVDQMDWFEAQAYCNNLYANSYLAEIKSAKTQQLLADHANR